MSLLDAFEYVKSYFYPAPVNISSQSSELSTHSSELSSKELSPHSLELETKYLNEHKSKMKHVLDQLISKSDGFEMKDMKSIDEGVSIQLTKGLGLRKIYRHQERKDHFLYTIEKSGDTIKSRLKHITVIRKAEQWKSVMRDVRKYKKRYP